MNIELARQCCLSLPSATEDMPFGEDDLAIRVAGKIFAFFDLSRPHLMVLKCHPERGEELRDVYNGIEPAWHWNKKHWIQLHFDSDVPDALFRELILHSYREVVAKLPRSVRQTLPDP